LLKLIFNAAAAVDVAFMLCLWIQEGQVIECSQVSDIRVGTAPKVNVVCL